ncbi:MAG: hypothetical protein CMG46_02360 [Candidatus Marinimicrobia bacterium]|nr:hypothetical protein [Candidatus Neomarinimicrobiota bacterium]|tara:strand:+ start:202 stop:705 length:504 start_codon:yes stop_codon:yes gene_type:complete
MKLLIKTNNEYLIDKYKNHGTYHEGDSGLDLFIPYDVVIKPGETVKVDLGIQCEAIGLRLLPPKSAQIREMCNPSHADEVNVSYYLYPRSSIVKTPLRLSNSVGIIDAGYRGNIIAYVDNIKNEVYTIHKGDRLFQICASNLEPITYQLVDKLTNTTREGGGFGSTG